MAKTESNGRRGRGRGSRSRGRGRRKNELIASDDDLETSKQKLISQIKSKKKTKKQNSNIFVKYILS